MYTYAAVITRIHDGYTVTVNLDMGRRIWVIDAPHRLYGCNARELKDPGGVEARDHLAALLPIGAQVTLRSIKPDKFWGRYDASITLPDGRDLVTLLVAEHWAAPWDGRGERPVPPWPRPEDATA
jgi:endonuclease YncB( thermonuclease family)